MKITASHSIKLPHPDPAIEFGSIGASVSIEGEPPPEVQGDRQKLAKYTQALLRAAERLTEEHLAQEGARAPNPQESRQNGQSRRPHRPMRGPNGRSNGDGHGGNGRSQASLKQVNFIRALSRDAGLSDDDLAYLAEDLCGARDMRSLSKRDASVLIEELQARSSRGA